MPQQIMAAGRRAAIRQGYPVSTSLSTPRHPQKTLLDPVPLFHITGMQMATFATVSGMKILFMRKWIPEDGGCI
jgi:acyl-CoA synthetase (AMP-forming)/AMP-acid ligase II